MIANNCTFIIEGQLTEDETWYTVCIFPAELTSIEEVTVTLKRYRTNQPNINYRLIKHEVIG